MAKLPNLKGGSKLKSIRHPGASKRGPGSKVTRKKSGGYTQPKLPKRALRGMPSF